MIGEKFGRLTVSGLSHRDERYRKWWLCKCECNRAKETLTVAEFADWAARLGAMAEQWGATR